MTKRRYVLDGEAFSTFEEFVAHFNAVVLAERVWNGNLDAFNDILRGGFGTPPGGFVLEWRHHAASQERLGHSEAARWLERLVETCHPTNVSAMREELAAARAASGATLFELLVDIIQEHGPGGSEAEDGVDLILA